jgi:two-component system chemotaxis sensor kinase CheA
MSNEFAEIFQEEAKELLEHLEQDLLDLEDDPENSDIIDRVFRTMHTIKGSGAMFGFTPVAEFTHHVENVLAEVRTGDVAVSRELISLILQSRDHITSLIASDHPDFAQGDVIIEQLSQLLEDSSAVNDIGAQGADDTDTSFESASDLSSQPLLDLCSALAGDLFVLVGTPDDLDVLARVVDEFDQLSLGIDGLGWHEFAAFPKGIARFVKICLKEGEVSLPFLDLCDAGRNVVEDVLQKGVPPASSAHLDLLQHLEAEVGQAVVDEAVQEPAPKSERIGEILVEKGHLEEEDVAEVISQQKPLGEMLIDAKKVSQDQVNEALEEQKKRKAAKIAATGQPSTIKTDSIRVAAEKLDVLINLVGELVGTQARLSAIGGDHPGSPLLDAIEDVERLTTELRECVLSVRMLPIGSTFSRFKRLVRDLSNDLGKEVQLVTSGAETELDKTMLEMLSEPLVHLIRNAVDHGIESAAERKAADKDSCGTISLSAVHTGPHVVVTIRDDGRGIDRAALFEKGVSLGLLSGESDPTEAGILELIFRPGMTTAKEVNAVSGRGVGMDVVHSSILSLKGTVTVESLPGVGTTLKLTLPLTMAIIDGLLVQVADTRFILPLLQVEECVELTGGAMGRKNGQHLYEFRGQMIPFIRLQEFYDFGGSAPEIAQMIVVRLENEFLGLVVDQIIGDHQTVIKSLGWVYRQAPGLSGATILGDGEVALIIDIAGVYSHAKAAEQLRVQ